MKHTKEFKYRYDEDLGVFIRESEISVNWLLSEVLKQEKLQITKISNEDIQRFLFLLDESDLRMPDGKHSLIWLKEQLKEKRDMSNAKTGKVWEDITERYRYILEQIDFTLMKSKNYSDKITIKKDESKKVFRTKSRMQAKFEPL